MNFKAKVTQVENNEDKYDVVIKTYKEQISGRWDREDIRHLIEVLDNSITVGLDATTA